MFRKDERALYRCLPLEELDWLDHGFGTRHSGDWPPAGQTASLQQIHSNRVVPAGNRGGCLGRGDALITAEPEVYLAVRTADCLPILLAAKRSRVVAGIHAGWRGTAANIAGATVKRLATEFGATPPELLAAIGPGIRACCYEVGPEVAERFKTYLPTPDPARTKTMLDLAEVNRRQLLSAGLEAGDIFIANQCTCCEPGEFYSYRRAPGEHGRMISAIGIRG